MNQEIHVTTENLANFQNWLTRLQAPDFNPNFRFDLPLSVILNGAPTLSPAAQETLAYVIAYGHGNADTMADAATMLDLAKTQPILLGRAYQRSGNTTSLQGGIFGTITNALRSRPFEQNIAALHTLLQYGNVYDAGTGDISKTSNENARYLNEIFKASQEYGNDQFHASANEFIKNLDMSKLINFETSMPEFRAYIDARNFGGYNNRGKLENLAHIDSEKITESTLKTILKSMQLSRPTTIDTTNANTQAEKNANILPAYYTKVRDALLRLAEQPDNNDGTQKTLSQRYKELCARLFDEKTWEYIDPNKTRGLIQDTYLIALQRDIIDGNAEKLTPVELQLVLDNDKNGFFIRKIDTKLLSNPRLRLSPKQAQIISARDAETMHLAMDGNALPLREKREVLSQMTKSAGNDAMARARLADELAAYDNADKQIHDTYTQSMNLGQARKIIEDIQEAYYEVTHNFKDGKANEHETSLAGNMIEDAIFNYLSGNTETDITIPDQGGLPLLMGRNAEKGRRAELESAIQNMNKILHSNRNKISPDILNIISKYKGNILNKQTISDITSMLNNTQRAQESMTNDLHRNHRNRQTISSEKNILDEKQSRLAQATDKLTAQEKRMRDLSRRHLGKDQTGTLTPVTDDMTADEKRATRAKNKAALADKLAARRGKKPARNLAEMLANADMDR